MKRDRLKYYENNDFVRILNWKQATFYWAIKGIEPLSVYPSKDFKTGEALIVFTFSKSETQEAYKEWMESRP